MKALVLCDTHGHSLTQESLSVLNMRVDAYPSLSGNKSLPLSAMENNSLAQWFSNCGRCTNGDAAASSGGN